jgi:hypothetical protein
MIDQNGLPNPEINLPIIQVFLSFGKSSRKNLGKIF